MQEQGIITLKQGDMSVESLATLQKLAHKLIRIVECDSVPIEKRLMAAFYHGCIKPSIQMRSLAVYQSVEYHLLAAETLVEEEHARKSKKQGNLNN